MDEPWADENEVCQSQSIFSDLRTLLANMGCGSRETPKMELRRLCSNSFPKLEEQLGVYPSSAPVSGIVSMGVTASLY